MADSPTGGVGCIEVLGVKGSEGVKVGGLVEEVNGQHLERRRRSQPRVVWFRSSHPLYVVV